MLLNEVGILLQASRENAARWLTLHRLVARIHAAEGVGIKCFHDLAVS